MTSHEQRGRPVGPRLCPTVGAVSQPNCVVRWLSAWLNGREVRVGVDARRREHVAARRFGWAVACAFARVGDWMWTRRIADRPRLRAEFADGQPDHELLGLRWNDAVLLVRLEGPDVPR